MRLTAIQLRSHDVRLDDFSPGMNVVYVPSSEQRRLLSSAVRAAIFGAVDDEHPDCRLSVQTQWGGFQLEYHNHDGSLLATDSQGQDRSQWLQQKLAALTTEAAFAAVYTPRWGDPVALDTLACVLCGDGLSGKRLAAFESLLRELENTRSWRERDQQLERLRTRQAQLEGELQKVQSEQHGDVHPALTLLDERIQLWGRRLESTQKSLHRARHQWRAHRSDASRSRTIESANKRLAGIQRHVQRLVLVLRDLRKRGRRLRLRIGAAPSQAIVESASAATRRKQARRKYQKLLRCQTVLSEQLATLLHRRQRLQHRLDRLSAARIDEQNRVPTLQGIARLEKREQRCRSELKLLEANRAALLAGRSLRPVNPQHIQELEAELSHVRARLARWAMDEQQEADALLARLRTFFAERRNPAVLNEAASLLAQLSDGVLVGIRAGNHGRELIIEHKDGRSVSCDVLSRAERVQVQLSLCLAAAAAAAGRGAGFPVILNDVTRHIQPARLRSAVELLRKHGRASGQVILLTSQPHVATLCRSLGASSYSLENPSAPARIAEHSAADGEASPIRETSWDCEEFPGELRDRMRIADQQGREQAWAPSSPREPFTVVRSEPHPRNGAPQRPLRTESTDATVFAGDELLRASGYYLELCDRVTEIPFLTRSIAQVLEREGVFTVANLLHADASQLTLRLADHNVPVTEIRDWQSQATLMCTVRRLRGYDAKILTACGITTAEQLADIQPHELYNMIQAFVATPEGSRIVRSGADHEVARLTQWIRSLQRSRQPAAATAVRADESKPADRVVTGNTDERAERGPKRPRRAVKKVSSKPNKATGRSADVLPLRFHLDLTSHIEAAPAIGPSMAKRLEKIGISTVGQLLNSTPEEVARHLKSQRVSAATVRQWQRQASLVCRVPELRGHDAQILVSCGIETPEKLASFNPDELGELVIPFVKTKQGRRMLRNGKEPDATEIAHWIQWARHARQLAAA